MLCPYCLRNATGLNCANSDCEAAIPPRYVEAHKRPLARKPVSLNLVGFSGHGKTVYVASLLRYLQHDLTEAWPDYYRIALDKEGVELVSANAAMLDRGELPESTRRNFPRPSIHRLESVPQYGSRTLVIYDPPGEAFESDEGVSRWAHYVTRANVVVFLVSLVDLVPPEDEDLYRLLNLYVLGMDRMKGKTRKQHLVVAYTKADRVVDRLKSCPVTLRLLAEPGPGLLARPKEHKAVMDRVSQELERFTERELGAAGFVRLARKEFRSLAFCAVSALGSQPEGERLLAGVESRCVVDPLLWVLERS